ncbi:MAG: NAD(+) synthase [Myxococcaceae bacterium]|jgi:NAD+ synthase (glutamine-hydrolysing)|nr:NAD(+) synthase [Myxococcaceae bacterium]
MRLVKIGLASVNTTVGAFGANVDRAVALAKALSGDGAGIAVFPEQCVAGYPAEDLVQWQGFVDRQWAELSRFAAETKALPMVSVLGVAVAHRGLRYNCAAVVGGGVVHGLVPKEKLPTYNIFYEGRTFARGVAGMKELHRGVPLGDFLFQCDFGLVGVEVCEDLWSADGPIKRRAYSGAELICNVSASPFRVGVEGTRRELVSTRAGDHQCTIAYVNQVGAQDGLVFDGGGYVNQNGRMALELPRFTQGQASCVVDLERTLRLRTENTTWRDDRKSWAAREAPVPVITVPVATPRDGLRYPVPAHRSFFLPAPAAPRSARAQYCEDLLDALALGIGDYFEKTRGFSRLGIALSGGRDSLLTLLIAHRWASRAKVPIETFYMPTRYSSEATRRAAETIAAELGVRFTVVSIDEAFERELAAAREMLGGQALTPITEQNVQARLRAQRMWNWANTSGGLFLQTGNMSEKAVGYTTIGGDLMGALAVIANLPKTVVMYLLDYLLEVHGYEGIRAVIARPAGPELAPNQVGEDELMPFPILDACFHLFAGEKLSPADVTAAVTAMFPEVPEAVLARHVSRFVRLFTVSIYKWVQSPISLHVGNLDLDRERALQLPVVTRTEW